jgi:hypothetical protein
MSREGRVDDCLRYSQDPDTNEIPPASYYRCECSTVCVEIIAVLIPIALPILVGNLTLYYIMLPIVLIILLAIWAARRADL